MQRPPRRRETISGEILRSLKSLDLAPVARVHPPWVITIVDAIRYELETKRGIALVIDTSLSMNAVYGIWIRRYSIQHACDFVTQFEKKWGSINEMGRVRTSIGSNLGTNREERVLFIVTPERIKEAAWMETCPLWLKDVIRTLRTNLFVDYDIHMHTADKLQSKSRLTFVVMRGETNSLHNLVTETFKDGGLQLVPKQHSLCVSLSYENPGPDVTDHGVIIIMERVSLDPSATVYQPLPLLLLPHASC